MGFLTYLGYKLFMEPISDLSAQTLKKTGKGRYGRWR